MDLIKAYKFIDRTQLYPALATKVDQLLINCEARGAIFFVTSGYRSHDDQAKLYAQGRTTPGTIVTNAKPGQSFHNFKLAVDLSHDKDSNAADGLQPDWIQANYMILLEEAPKVGLVSGLSWSGFKDAPHLELDWMTLAQLQAAYALGGIDEVISQMDAAAPA